MGFVYSILNTSNGKIYVGQTTQGRTRFSQHISSLRRDNHPNNHLQSSWNKYGEDSFEFNVLENCDNSRLDANEKWWINYFDATNPKKGYNLKTGGSNNFVFSESSLNKMSESHKGKTILQDVREKMSKAHKGKKLSDEHRRKLSESKKGVKNPMYGLTGELNPTYGRCRELSGMWKSYPRIVKNGFKNGKQNYGIKYEGKLIKTSIFIDKLEEYLDKMEI